MGPGTAQPLGVVTRLPRQQVWALGSWAWADRVQDLEPQPPLSRKDWTRRVKAVVSLPASPEKTPQSTGLAFPYSAPSAVPVLGHLAASPLEGLLGPNKESHMDVSGLEEVKKPRLSRSLTAGYAEPGLEQRPTPQMLLVCCPSSSVSCPENSHITSHLINT